MGRVFSLSLDIFAQLALNFRESLKGEIGVFFKEVLLRLLETPNSSEKQKLAGMRGVAAGRSGPTNRRGRSGGNAAAHLPQPPDAGGHIPQLRLRLGEQRHFREDGFGPVGHCQGRARPVAVVSCSLTGAHVATQGHTGSLREISLRSSVSIMSSLATWADDALADSAAPANDVAVGRPVSVGGDDVGVAAAGGAAADGSANARYEQVKVRLPALFLGVPSRNWRVAGAKEGARRGQSAVCVETKEGHRSAAGAGHDQ